MLSGLKAAVLPGGAEPRQVLSGVYRGARFEIDLRTQSQLYLGLWERETYAALRLAAGRCAWAIDVGAGGGELPVYLLRHATIRQVVAIEPQADEIARLRRQLALNGLEHDERLTVIGRCAGLATSPDTVAVDTLPVDRSARGFLKIDVDGGEVEVLAGAASLLRAARMDVLVETHSADLERGCLDRLGALGYRCTIIPNGWWRWLLPERRPIAHNRWLWATRPDLS